MPAKKVPPRPNAYQREFWIIAARSLPHHGLLVFSKRLRAEFAAGLLERSRQKQLELTSTLQPYSRAAIKAYTRVTRHTRLWHGTGRLQYANGKVTDTFTAILKAGSLNPGHDAYAVFIGGEEMASISTTPLRMIARSYADTHGKGERERHRYGSSLWWVAYYYSIFYGEVFTKYSPRLIRNISKWRAATGDDSGERLWGKKVHTGAYSVWDVFGSGSDIPGNYPVLFGIARHGTPIELPKVMAKAEVRLSGPVLLSDLSHIEVPEEKVAEIEAVLGQYHCSVPVFPIELGEYAASRQPFARLIGLKTS